VKVYLDAVSEVRRGEDALTLSHGGVELFRYVFRPTTAARESTKPYFHPIRTLQGRVVTIFRPADHVWHHGLAMTSAHLSGQNFWGGPTYVRDRGYVPLENNGAQEHLGWEGDDRERLRWRTAGGETWVQETRQIGWRIEPEHWSLELAFALTNVAGRTLEFSSPTVEGRPMAGYGGLFWRGPAEWTGGEIVNAEMGQSAPWIAVRGPDATVGFVDDPANPRYPTKWFVRREPYACIAAAFSFDEPYELAAGQTLRLRYRVVIADGAWRGP
jgi:hypothetical protein